MDAIGELETWLAPFLAPQLRPAWKAGPLKPEVGLGDFEGRSWTGLHRHALMACIAHAHLQHLRLQGARAGGQE